MWEIDFCGSVNHATALDAAVLAPWSSTGGVDSATCADYSTGRAAYGFSAKKDLLSQLLRPEPASRREDREG